MADASGTQSMSIIVTKGTLDWAYPPMILSTTAAAMGLNVTLFFTFYGLTLLLKDPKLRMSPLGNPAMKMPMMGGHMGMPNIMSMIPGVDAGATAMMQDMMKKKGVASFEELRSLALESDVRMIACPLPILKAKKAITALPAGGTLEVLATDPGAVKDFAAFSRTTGHELIEQTTEGNVFRFVLKRKA